MTIVTFRRSMNVNKVSGSESSTSRMSVESSSSFYKPKSSNKDGGVDDTENMQTEKPLRRRRGQEQRENRKSLPRSQLDLCSRKSQNHDDSATTITSTSSSSEQPIARKKVTFHKTARVKRVKPRTHYTAEQHREMWYNDFDYTQIKRRAVETVRIMMKSARSGIAFVDDDDHSARGLECRTKNAATERKQFKEYARMLVLDEQEDQDQLGFRSVSRLRRMYLKASNISSNKAREKGRRDAEAANDACLQEVLKLVRQEHASS
eukprot:jgi/Psemu1/10821/gm1.10821_g